MTRLLNELPFNTEPSYFMHIDLNSCFATVEQQANPLLRGKPIAVAAYKTDRGIIIAPSVEAKRLGIRVGTRIKEARLICPKIVILEPDPDKYRYVHHCLRDLLSYYTHDLVPKSVDEFALNFEQSPYLSRGMFALGKEIKERIKKEIGDYLTVSIGISKNRFLAKTASNLKKPDGLEEITKDNFWEVYKNLKLTDLCGVAGKTACRLNSRGIFTVRDFYSVGASSLNTIFGSVVGYYWYYRLHGYEIEKYPLKRRTFGQQYALYKPTVGVVESAPVLIKLVEKMSFRLRCEGYWAQGISLYLVFKDNTYWHQSRKTEKILFDPLDFYKEAVRLFLRAPEKPIGVIGVSCFNLRKKKNLQLELFTDAGRKEALISTLDKINFRWGKFVISPAGMLLGKDCVPDRIGFGNVS